MEYTKEGPYDRVFVKSIGGLLTFKSVALSCRAISVGLIKQTLVLKIG